MNLLFNITNQGRSTGYANNKTADMSANANTSTPQAEDDNDDEEK